MLSLSSGFNYYLYSMKSEEKSIQAISAQAHSEAADNRLLRKKLQARDKRVVELEAMVSNLNKQLCEKVDQLNDMMQKLVTFMTGNGEVNLSDSLREAVVAFKLKDFSEDAMMILEDGSLDLSNNVCERQIRRIAKYRNNSYFVGSPESGVRFARLMSHFANIRKHNLEPMEYLCGMFCRIKNTAKDKLVDLLAHRWQLATVTAWE